MLISLALGFVLAGGASVRPYAVVRTTALSAPTRPRASHWAPPAAAVAPVPGRTRFSRRSGVSRVERDVTPLGARTTVAPHHAWTVLAGSAERLAPSPRAASAFERGPPPLF